MATDENNEVVAVRKPHVHYELADQMLRDLEQLEARVAEGNIMEPYAIAQINAARYYSLRKAAIHATLAGARFDVQSYPSAHTCDHLPAVDPTMGSDAL